MFAFGHPIGRQCWPSGEVDELEQPLILVAEDECPLQGAVKGALVAGGFAVDVLLSAEEAFPLFRRGTKDYRALVTDVNLKGHMDSWEVARQVGEREPTFPVVYMTGAAADEQCFAAKALRAPTACHGRFLNFSTPARQGRSPPPAHDGSRFVP